MEEARIASTWFDSKRIKELRIQSQAYSSKEDLWSWYVLRRISIFVTLFCLKVKATPNAISWLSAFFVMLSGFFVIQATPLGFIFAFLSYNLGYLLDCVDGEVARLTKNTSSKGYFIDLLIQGATLPVYLSILFALLNMFGLTQLTFWTSIIIYFMICIIISALFVPIAYQLTDLNSRVGDRVRDPVNKIRTKSIVFEVMGFILGLPGFFFIILLLTGLEILFNVSVINTFIILYLAIMVLKVLARFVITVKSFEDRQSEVHE